MGPTASRTRRTTRARTTSGARSARRVEPARASQVRFRLYPEAPRGLYISVIVHPDAAALRRWAKTHDDEDSSGPRVQGYCACFRITSFKRGRPARTLPLTAEVHMHRERLTMEVVTHELFHATVQWARRIGFDFGRLHADDSINEDEERLTYAHSTLCSTFMVRAIKAGLYPNHSEVVAG